MEQPAPSAAYRIAAVSLLGVVAGAAASLAAIAFVDAVLWLNRLLLVAPYTRIQYEQYPGLVTAATVAVPALGGLLVGLLVRGLVAEGRGLGPPDAILAAQAGGRGPGLRSGAGSTLAALVSLGSGASVGQYGPLVYMGSMLGALAGRLERRLGDLRPIAIGCGVAAAIATAFNAPIAGLVFAHEVILRHYSLRAFAPVTVAAAVGYVLANVVFQRPPLFLVEFEGVRHSYEFALFALEGVLAAGLAVGFMGLVGSAGRAAAASRLPPWSRPMAAGLALGVTALFVPEVLGIGQETLRFATIPGAFGLEELALILAAKVALTALCVGFGFVGGVFSPALLIGILGGALYGSALAQWLPVAHSGVVVYAVCGMMAVTSPVIGAPLTTILIVFELTHSYDLTVAAMVAVVFANLVAYQAYGRSMFDVQLARRGFDLSQGRDKAILDGLPVTDYMSGECSRLDPGATVAQLVERLAADGCSEAVLVDAAGYYRGMLRLPDVQGRAPDGPLAALADTEALCFTEDTTIWEAMERMRGFVGEAVPVVDRDGRFLGVVPEGRVIGAYLQTVHRLRREENAGI